MSQIPDSNKRFLHFDGLYSGSSIVSNEHLRSKSTNDSYNTIYKRNEARSKFPKSNQSIVSLSSNNSSVCEDGGDCISIDSHDNFNAVDYLGRAKIRQSVDDTIESEEPPIFLSEWKDAREASVSDAFLASSCVWPDINRVVKLNRFDLFQSVRQVLQVGTCDLSESRRLRASGEWHYILSFFCFDERSPLTREISVYSTNGPKRDKFIPTDRSNSKDFTKWVLKGKIHGLIGTDRIPGAQDYYIDFQDTPDVYIISNRNDPTLGFRRLFSFAAYSVSQYYILQKVVRHDALETEGGEGLTCVIEKGHAVFSRKRWRLLGSFYGFDHPLPSSNRYSVYCRKDPFPRMLLTIGDGILEKGWILSYQFYSFDIALPGTVSYQLQHCLKSIYTIAAPVSRHRLTVNDEKLPWEYVMTLFVFPASIDDCVITTSLESVPERTKFDFK